MMEKLAIIGSGIAGMGCAYFLRRRFDITVLEAAAHVGGHSNTVMAPEDGREVPVDTGFMVYNEVTYPHLTRLFKELAVPTKSTEMTFSVHHGPSGLEWNGSGFDRLFGQRRNLVNLGHWRFLFQLDRFNKEAVAALDDPRWAAMTLAEYVAARNYGVDFLERYLVPMSSAVWSTPPDRMLKFPAQTLLRFWHNHGFLGLHTHHPWRTVDGGSREYVKRLTRDFQDRIFTSTPVKRIARVENGVEVSTEARGTERFDRVIVATHGDQALRLLSDPTKLEQALLSAFKYQPNDVDLHSDPGFMPDERRCWASWNYRTEADRSTTHYWMNRLQGVSDHRNYFVSLNSRDRIGEGLLHRSLQYEHPLFDLPAISAQKRLPELNEAGEATRTYFCGSYFRYGFHEDALLSAVNLSTQILGGDPWNA